MAILKKVVQYEPVEIDPGELITMEEAARLLGMTNAGVRSAMNRGELDEYIDDGRTWQGRRVLLRSQVLRLAGERKA